MDRLLRTLGRSLRTEASISRHSLRHSASSASASASSSSSSFSSKSDQSEISNIGNPPAPTPSASPAHESPSLNRSAENSENGRNLPSDTDSAVAEAQGEEEEQEFKNPLTGEVGGPKGLEPTRFGDWEKGGRCYDF